MVNHYNSSCMIFTYILFPWRGQSYHSVDSLILLSEDRFTFLGKIMELFTFASNTRNVGQFTLFWYLIPSWREKIWMNGFPKSLCAKDNTTDKTWSWTQWFHFLRWYPLQNQTSQYKTVNPHWLFLHLFTFYTLA